ncbi:MAG: PIN domain-containing protein [Pseudomonadota bacterium]
MKILFDTNVILDVYLNRMPHVHQSAPAIAYVENGIITGVLCAHTITTTFYFLEKSLGGESARTHIANLLSIFDVAAVNRSVLMAALKTGFNDYEDAVIYEAALSVDADAIVTRNGKDFLVTKIPAFTPGELLAVVSAF